MPETDGATHKMKDGQRAETVRRAVARLMEEAVLIHSSPTPIGRTSRSDSFIGVRWQGEPDEKGRDFAGGRERGGSCCGGVCHGAVAACCGQSGAVASNPATAIGVVHLAGHAVSRDGVHLR